ncbi:MAG: hypothetical protein M1840_005715 [Geoglossum simile]|nr:MAG: hypothetical protein M1840_005715 [Geoglossum simile]
MSLSELLVRRFTSLWALLTAHIIDLSTVAEDPPIEYPNLEPDVLPGEGQHGMEGAGMDAPGDIGPAESDDDGPGDGPESPAAFSTMSGTTARTSHSAQELADLDADVILEVLPTLSDTSSGLLGVLAPADATMEGITNIAKELLVPGSRTSRRVKFHEGTFKSARGEFGSDHYIDVSIINRALLGVRLTRDIGTGSWLPDPLLQKANLAIFATRMFVHQRGSQDLWAAVALLDSKFPAPFLSSLEPNSVSGVASSRLRETFDLALNLRTQLMLIILSQHVDKPNYDPDKILMYVFFEPPDGSSTNRVKGWAVPGLGGGGSRLPDEFGVLVLERIQRIRQSFTEPSESLFVAGEPAEMPAELKRLEETFPWIEFLSEVVNWTNLRLGDIERRITEQGGTGAIISELRGEMERRRNDRSQNAGNDEAGEGEEMDDEGPGEERLIDLTFDPLVWKTRGASDQESVTGGLLSGAQKVSGLRWSWSEGHLTDGRPLLSFNNAAGVTYLKKREATRRSIRGKDLPTLYSPTSRAIDNQTASVAGPSRQHQTVDSESQPGPVTESQDEDDWRPQYDDEDDMGATAVVPSSVPPPSSADIMVDRYDRHQREKNKENHIVAPKPKKSFIDPQVGAKRVDFSEESEDTQPTSFQKPKALDKGKKRARDVEAEEEIEDDDFEVDDRPVRETHRKRLRTEPQRDQSPTPVAASPSPELSQHHQHQQTWGAISSQKPHDRQRSPKIRKAARGRFLPAGSVVTSDDSVSDYAGINEHEEEAIDGSVNYRNVNTLAKRYVVTAKPYKPQARRQWTEQEVVRFIELVEEHGPSWAKIEKVGDPLLAGRTQVNLKDKARNMKFDFVKAGSEIPVGFDTVRLSRNQINMLREIGNDYDQ